MATLRRPGKKTPPKPADEPERLTHHWFLTGASGATAFAVGWQSTGLAGGVMLGLLAVGTIDRTLQ